MAVAWYEQVLAGVAGGLSRIRVWHRWPFPIALPMLAGHRIAMRRQNLYDTETAPQPQPQPPTQDIRGQRTADGSYNDLGKPWMGMAGSRFGRNMPIQETFGEEAPGLYEPNPRLISEKLLARQEFIPVPHLNVLVPAWLQFMVHDWLSHGENHPEEHKHKVPALPGDSWPYDHISILRTAADRRRQGDEGRPETYTNIETHWWDGSQIYGSSLARQQLVRTDPATGQVRIDGKLGMMADGHLPLHTSHKNPRLELAGVNGNWWAGLSVMHTLFAREHNAIVDRLRADYPTADGEWLFQKARLANAALMAKIHTTEWTPALMNSPEGRLAMRANWWGLFGERHARGYGRSSDSELLYGVVGSPADHHSAPYTLTEEFAAVYRMHPLMPDDYSFRNSQTDQEVARTDLVGAARNHVRDLYDRISFNDVLYSLATSHPGALALHNYPNSLRMMPEVPRKTDIDPKDVDVFVDLATTDILRDRERGVPRYCAFRRRLGMRVPKSFEQLTDDPVWRRELKEVYGKVERVDLLTGTLAESRSRHNGTPPGFGFSDTAFRIFILMATRRLKSDRFYTEDFTPAVYTPAGFAWVRDSTFRSVLDRHVPELSAHYSGARNVFFPWKKGPI